MTVHASTSLVAALLLLLPVAGCGNGDEAPRDPRLLIETLTIDGEPPQDLRAQWMAPDGESGPTFDLVPVSGGRYREYAVEGGPEGRYFVRPPAGWGSISGAAVLPEATRDRTPGRTRVGRSHTLYLGPVSRTIRPGILWGVERIEPDGTRRPVAHRVEVEPPGLVTALRFEPEAWHGKLLVVGHLVLGPPGAEVTRPGLGPLSEPLEFEVPPDGTPVLGQLRVASVRPLTIVPVPATEAVDVEGIRVQGDVLGLPLRVRSEVVTRGGAAHFPGLPVVERPVRFTLPDRGASFDVPQGDWRRAPQRRVLALGAEPTRVVEVVVGTDAPVDRVQVRPAGAVAFGRLPHEPIEGGVALRVPRTPCRILLQSGSAWSAATAEGTDDERVEARVLGEGVTVSGRVHDAETPCDVRFFRHVGEGEAVLGDGFVVPLSDGNTYEARLPPGTYEVEVLDRKGLWRRAEPLDATRAGMPQRLPLESK